MATNRLSWGLCEQGLLFLRGSWSNAVRFACGVSLCHGFQPRKQHPPLMTFGGNLDIFRGTPIGVSCLVGFQKHKW